MVNAISHKLEHGILDVKATDLEDVDKILDSNPQIVYIIGLFTNTSLGDPIIRSTSQKLRENTEKRSSDFVHGLLSYDAYKDRTPNEAISLEGFSGYDKYLKDWAVSYVSKVESTGYYGVIYKNDKRKQIVLAHRGTDGFKDFRANFQGVVMRNPDMSQFNNCFDITLKSLASEYNGYNLSITGHSLGAFLSELSAFFCKRERNLLVQVVNFESPGSMNVLEKLQSNIEKVKIRSLRVKTYLSSPNLINTCNRHLGQVFSLDKIYEPGDFLNLSKHRMSYLLERFDADLGVPRSYYMVKDWPLGSVVSLSATRTPAQNKFSSYTKHHKVVLIDHYKQVLRETSEHGAGKLLAVLQKAKFSKNDIVTRAYIDLRRLYQINQLGTDVGEFEIVIKDNLITVSELISLVMGLNERHGLKDVIESQSQSTICRSAKQVKSLLFGIKNAPPRAKL